MSESPSAILNRAADLIRDTAAAATPGPWTLVAFESDLINQADIKWIALMSPAVAGPISTILREAAANCDRATAEGWTDAELLTEADEGMRAAFALARAVLGEKEETDGQ